MMFQVEAPGGGRGSYRPRLFCFDSSPGLPKYLYFLTYAIYATYANNFFFIPVQLVYSNEHLCTLLMYLRNIDSLNWKHWIAIKSSFSIEQLEL